MDHRTLIPESGGYTLEGLLETAKNEEDGAILYEAESEIKPKTGYNIPVTLRFISMSHPDGEAFLGIVHDIRDLKDLEARLASSQARYRGIVENVNEIYIVKPRVPVVNRNKGFCRKVLTYVFDPRLGIALRGQAIDRSLVQIHAVNSPILVAAGVLQIQDVFVCVGPAIAPDASVSVAGNGRG